MLNHEQVVPPAWHPTAPKCSPVPHSIASYLVPSHPIPSHPIPPCQCDPRRRKETTRPNNRCTRARTHAHATLTNLTNRHTHTPLRFSSPPQQPCKPRLLGSPFSEVDDGNSVAHALPLSSYLPLLPDWAWSNTDSCRSMLPSRHPKRAPLQYCCPLVSIYDVN